MRIIQDRDEFMNDVKQFADGYRSRNKEVDALRAQVASLEERLREAQAVINRLGSMEAFTHSRAIDPRSPGDQELLARIDFARNAMKDKP